MPELVRAVVSSESFFAGEQPVLAGEDGLMLRPWRDADAEQIVRAYEDPALQQWHMRSMDRSEAPGWIELRRRRWNEAAGVDWAVCGSSDEATVLGRMAIHRVWLNQGLGEVAYWTAPGARGRRLAPRALAALCEWAFAAKGMHRLELGHAIANTASCRVAERAGFALEGVKRSELRHPDGWHDMHLHARLAGDPAPVD